MAKDGQQKQLLIDKFKQKQASRLGEVEESTKLVLTQLSETLTQHVSDELATTKATISQQSSAISSLLSSQSQALNSHSMTLDKMKSITQSETSLIRRDLTEALREIQSEALRELKEAQSKTLHEVHKMQHDLINRSIAPLKESMTQVLEEGEALSRMTLRAWLKPVSIGGGLFLGFTLVALFGAKAMDELYGYRINKLETINAQIAEGKAVLKSLPSGIIYTESDGTKYIIAKKIGTAFIPSEAYSGKMAVAVETK